jgi:hypothetical protein
MRVGLGLYGPLESKTVGTGVTAPNHVPINFESDRPVEAQAMLEKPAISVDVSG